MGADLFEGRLVRFLGGVHALLEMIEVRNEPREVEASRGVDCTEPPVGPPRGVFILGGDSVGSIR